MLRVRRQRLPFDYRHPLRVTSPTCSHAPSPLFALLFPLPPLTPPAVRTTLIRSPVRSLTCYFRFRIRFVCCRRRNLTKSHVSHCRSVAVAVAVNAANIVVAATHSLTPNSISFCALTTRSLSQSLNLCALLQLPAAASASASCRHRQQLRLQLRL